MRTPFGSAALTACAVLLAIIGGCAPPPAESTSANPPVAKSEPATSTVVAATPSPVAVATSSPPVVPKAKTSRPAPQLAELIVLEGELRLKLNAATDPAVRDSLARRISQTEKQRIALYRSLTSTENVP